MTRTVYIYGMLCPLKKEIRYVGKSNQPATRFRQHLTVAANVCQHRGGSDSIPHRQKKERWISVLLEQDQAPELVILETVEVGDWESAKSLDLRTSEREDFWIQRLLHEGHDLTNVKIAASVRNDEALQKAMTRGREMFGSD